MTNKVSASKKRAAKKPKVVYITLPNGKELNLTPQDLGGFIVGTYDWGAGDGNIDLTEAMTKKDCKEVGNLFIKVLDEGICYRPQ